MFGISPRSPLVAGCLLALIGIAPAAAQYYPQPAPNYYPRPYTQPQPGYQSDDDDDQPQFAPGYPRPRYRADPYRQPGGPYGQRPGVGYHCATGRGMCETGYGAPLRAPCRCEFGFETKRGVVVP